MAFIGALLVLNVGNLWHLVTHTTGGPLALAAMTVFCWITFGSVRIVIRIMMMGDDKGGGGTRASEPVGFAPEPVALPIPLRAETHR